MNGKETWPPPEFVSSREELLEFKDFVQSVFREDTFSPQVPYLANHLVIRSCGHIEVVYSSCILGYIARHSSSAVYTFAEKRFKTWEAPTPGNLSRICETLSRSVSDDLSAFFESADVGIAGSCKSELGSLVSSRKKIAHGQNERVATLKAIQMCENVAIPLSDWFVDEFRPGGKADDY